MTIAVRISVILILFAALIILTYPVWAQDLPVGRQGATPGGTRRVETIKDKLATKEAALKEKLAKFKDKRKAEITERVSKNLNRINEKHTQMMLKFLDRASSILSKLEERVNRGTADIKDAVAAKAAIASAKESIASATASVNAQAAKDYTITITSEGRVKVDAQAARKQLHDDLQAARKQVVDAKQAVANAIRIAKSGPSTSSGSREATESGQ